jgi:hypothetical protein
MKKITWEQLPKTVQLAMMPVLRKRSKLLKTDIVAAWPVKSGRSKAGWKLRGNQYSSSVVNHVVSPEGYDYVPRLWEGLPLGSRQLPNGGDPIVRRHYALLLKDIAQVEL